jgi:hypothetical protein
MNRIYVALLLATCIGNSHSLWAQNAENIAHVWNEEVLEGIRNDFARPTVHARNLLHTSIAMYDCWSAYDEGTSESFLLGKSWAGFDVPFSGVDIPNSSEEINAARSESISYAIFRIMAHRFGSTPDGAITMFNINSRMAQLGYSPDVTTTDYENDGPAALGNYVAEKNYCFWASRRFKRRNGLCLNLLRANQSKYSTRKPRQPQRG